MDKIKTLLTKYLQVLGGAAGKEIDNIRAKMAWSLAEDVLLAQPTMPVSVEDLSASLDRALQEHFPFCERVELKEVSPDQINVVITGCFLKEANEKLQTSQDLSLCPMAPFFIYVFSRNFRQNAWLEDYHPTQGGCILSFSLSNRCSCSSD
ncbi:MAG: hypothetical protein GX750_05150 [Clostridia bacterium]|nr:hypothetical protein [Clostridia bacterium]